MLVNEARSVLRIALALAGLTCLMQSVEAQPRYTITDLGTIYLDSRAKDINERGQVVGEAGPLFRTAPNSVINPETDKLGSGGFVTGINGSGQVVGGLLISRTELRAFRTAPNSAINYGGDILGTLGGTYSSADGINDSGQVVGAAYTASGRSHAFRTAPNKAINPATDDLGTLGGTSSFAQGINDSGQVVGYAYTASGASHAFRTAPNKAINPATDDLGTLGGTSSFACRINDSGQVVGYAYTASGANHAFRTAPNKAINPATDDLGTLGGASSRAYSINNSGQVVGESQTPGSGDPHGFLYTGGIMYDLVNLIPADSGWAITRAVGINDAGQIAGSGIHNGQFRAFRMDSVARLAVAIRIKGGEQQPAPINSDSNGRIQVTILFSATFNAPVILDRTSLTFGRTGDEHSLEFCLSAEGVKGDRFSDLVCQFRTITAGFLPGDTIAVLKGKTYTGTLIMGTGAIRVNK